MHSPNSFQSQEIAPSLPMTNTAESQMAGLPVTYAVFRYYFVLQAIYSVRSGTLRSQSGTRRNMGAFSPKLAPPAPRVRSTTRIGAIRET
jgi:hypothetical protein